jgi:hypothetical protein
MALVMDDSAKEGTRRDNLKPQVFVGGTSDFEFETGAKTIHKYNHEPKAREAGTSVAKAGAKTAASVHADAMDAMHENSMDMLPNHVIFAIPQGISDPDTTGTSPSRRRGVRSTTLHPAMTWPTMWRQSQLRERRGPTR